MGKFGGAGLRLCDPPPGRAPWGRPGTGGSLGRLLLSKPLLLVGFALEIVRAVLFAFSTEYAVLVVAQLLGGVSAAAVTVLTVLVITDLTTGTGRFNLVRGSVGTVIAVAASVSTTASGFIFQTFGHWAGFLSLATAALIAAAFLWAAMPETRPAKYLD